jgi:hypothetical protein
MPLTVAGVAVPFEDEFKHFKFILERSGLARFALARALLMLRAGLHAVTAPPARVTTGGRLTTI